MTSKILMMVYTFIFFLLNVAPSLQVRFSVIGLDLPLVIPPGDDAVLPCHLSPQINAQEMTIRWFKDNYQNLVHFYQDKKDRFENQMPEYRSRTTLIKDGIKAGRVYLIIHNVRQSDSGLYTCFYDTGSFYEEAVVELMVAVLGSKPHVYLEDLHNRGVGVVCESSWWYPEPEAQWTDDSGNNISSSTEVKAIDGSLQFHVKVTYMFNGLPNTLSCRIRNPILNEWKQSTIHITDAFFQRISSCILSRILISASFTALGILLSSWTVYLVNEQRKRLGKLSVKLGELSEELGRLPKERDWRRALRSADAWLCDRRFLKSRDYYSELRDVMQTDAWLCDRRILKSRDYYSELRDAMQTVEESEINSEDSEINNFEEPDFEESDLEKSDFEDSDLEKSDCEDSDWRQTGRFAGKLKDEIEWRRSTTYYE